MFRANSEATIEITGVAAGTPTGLPRDHELRQLIDAIDANDGPAIARARIELSVLVSPEFAASACAVSANFHMMNRILDAIGIPPAPHFAGIADELGFDVTGWR